MTKNATKPTGAAQKYKRRLDRIHK